MTSRLKHKLELENVNLKSAYLNESFVQIGTPLPDLASTRKDKLEYVPEWQQEVRDEKGRRRFHGAFTGGFSAGYFNSVGSKEGWAPSEFKSSRNNRANRSQRPEDFMDEEDLQQMNDDRRLENTETFRNEAFAGERRPGADAGPSALKSLIAPAKSTIGQTLLQKQGWKPGQGIGPRITLRKLRIQEGKLGRRRTGIDDEDEEIEQKGAGKHLFAPRDSRLVVYRVKDDKEGLGYEKGRGMGRIPPKDTIASLHRPTDDPDEDMYEAGPSTSLAFAFDQNADDDVITMGGPSSREQRTQPGDYAQSGDRWHDGRPVLSGFALDPLGVPTDKWFDMPEIPADWRPRPARVWGTGKKWDETPDTKVEVKPVVRGAPGQPLTSEQRGAALGEIVAPPQVALVEEAKTSQAKSVFEYMSEKDRERLAAFAAAAKGLSAPPPALAKEEAAEQTQRPVEEIDIPPLSPRTASSALRGFVPYGDDLAKQERYRSYLSSQTYNTTTPMPDLRTGTVEEINKELQDFAASARIFKPMSFAMSNRFTAGSSSLAATDLKQPKAGLHLYDAEKAKADMEKPKGEAVAEVKHKNPREEAAAKGMYGPLTRETRTFYPEKLLCRRFGVQNPYPDGDPSKGEKAAGSGEAGAISDIPANDASWQDAFIHKELDVPAVPTAPAEDARPKSIAEVGMAEDSTQGRDTLTYVKPSIDIFKAIFEADSDSEDEEAVPGAATADTSASKVGEDPFPVKQEAPADLATFRPVFQNRRDGEGEEKAERKKAKKDKKKRKGVLSFEVDPEEEAAEKEFKKKKRNLAQASLDNGTVEKRAGSEVKSEPAEAVEEEWVEKPVSYVKTAARKGAADFM